MPATPQLIVVDSEVEVAVTIRDSNGSTVTAYTTKNGSSTHSFPVTLSSRTEFYLTAITAVSTYTVSALYNGVEVAGPDGDRAPVELHPTGSQNRPGYVNVQLGQGSLELDELLVAASSGGSPVLIRVNKTITMAELLACGEGGTYVELVAAVANKLIMVMQPFTARIAFGQTIPAAGFLTYDVGYPPEVNNQTLFTPALFSENEIATNDLASEPDGSNTPQGSVPLDPHLRPFTLRRMGVAGNDQVYFSDLLYGSPLVLFSDATTSLAGPIVTKHVVAGGTGYAPGDTGEIASDPISNANNSTYTVLTAPGGVVATVSVTPHADYAYYKAATTYATTVTTGGGNSGLTIGVDSIPAADGDFSVSFVYMLV